MSEPHLTERQLEVLRALADLDRVPWFVDWPTLAHQLGVTRRTATNRAKEAIRLGLAIRGPKGWRLTPSGREVLERMGGVR